MVAHRDNEHEFALYVDGLSDAVIACRNLLRIEDSALVHRITHVLRLQKDDTLMLFDQRVHVKALLESIEKKAIMCRMHELEQNASIRPHVTAWLPLLKREAFEEAIYACVELGVSDIRLMRTTKEQRHWTGEKELRRLHNIMVAAAEQSKNFTLAGIHEPRTLQELISLNTDAQGIFFDVAGEPLFDAGNRIACDKKRSYVICVGPEGDLTDAEKYLLQKADFMFVRLTPTVLRAQQAFAVGVGAIRSLL